MATDIILEIKVFNVVYQSTLSPSILKGTTRMLLTLILAASTWIRSSIVWTEELIDNSGGGRIDGCCTGSEQYRLLLVVVATVGILVAG